LFHDIVPEPNETVELRMEDGATIRIRRHGNPNGPRLALSHGNGLAIDGYVTFWKLFCDRYDVLLFDIRNHGQNPYHGPDGHNWSRFVSDAEAIYEGICSRWGRKPTAGIFHSLSAVIAIGQAVEVGPRWDLMVLFDPPLPPPKGHSLYVPYVEEQEELSRRSVRRIERFKDPLELAERLRRNPRFSRWRPEAYEAVARATLRPTSDGDYELCCPRELEARIYATSPTLGLWEKIPKLSVPVKLVCADLATRDESIVCLLGRALHEEFGIGYEMVTGAGHFLQLEQPERCAQAVERFLKEMSFGNGPDGSAAENA